MAVRQSSKLDVNYELNLIYVYDFMLLYLKLCILYSFLSQSAQRMKSLLPEFKISFRDGALFVLAGKVEIFCCYFIHEISRFFFLCAMKHIEILQFNLETSFSIFLFT